LARGLVKAGFDRVQAMAAIGVGKGASKTGKIVKERLGKLRGSKVSTTAEGSVIIEPEAGGAPQPGADARNAPKGAKTVKDFLPEAQKRLDAAKAKYGDVGAKMSRISGNPYTGPNAPAQAYKHLEKFHGLDPTVASNRLHKIKAQAGLGATDDVAIGRTGDVYNALTGERLGSLTDKTLGQ
jgi:hypothetical protein